MVATVLNYLRAGRINDLPLRLLILSGLTSFVIGVTMAWPSVLHVVYYCFARSIYVGLVVIIFSGLMFSFFAPLFIGHKNASRISAWSWQTAAKALIWLLKACFLFAVNTAVLLFNLFLAAISPGDVAPKAGEAVSHYIERSADMILHP